MLIPCICSTYRRWNRFFLYLFSSLTLFFVSWGVFRHFFHGHMLFSAEAGSWQNGDLILRVPVGVEPYLVVWILLDILIFIHTPPTREVVLAVYILCLIIFCILLIKETFKYCFCTLNWLLGISSFSSKFVK